jgi:hypothetical protein
MNVDTIENITKKKGKTINKGKKPMKKIKQNIENIENIENGNLDNNKEIPVKKKRGRKKKIKTQEEIEKEKNKPKQRRGRKPKSLFNKLTEENTKKILENNDNNETIILNLKIGENKKSINEEPLGNINNTDYYFLNEDINSNLIDNNLIDNNLIDNNLIDNNLIDNNLIDNSLVDNNLMDNSLVDNNLVDNNLINDKENNNNCFWCCHNFNNKPFGIPFKYKNGMFYTKGNFCSLECATAYNFYEKKNIQDVWECYNLINYLSHQLKLDNKVKIAPYRECLKCFGGNLTIEEFRNYHNNNNKKIFNQLEYPLIPIQKHIEEINYNESINNDFIPIDKNRLNRLEQKIKLSKKNLNYLNKNSLEQTMNIKIKV